MIQKYNIAELLMITKEDVHLHELVCIPPYNDEGEIFDLLDELSESIKDKMKPKMTVKEIKSIISEWIDKKNRRETRETLGRGDSRKRCVSGDDEYPDVSLARNEAERFEPEKRRIKWVRRHGFRMLDEEGSCTLIHALGGPPK
ncbi:MAG: hypothetical protein QFX32_06020 [Methanolinea sp.]|nr:hypothetical protein [Methanolinea sp.]